MLALYTVCLCLTLAAATGQLGLDEYSVAVGGEAVCRLAATELAENIGKITGKTAPIIRPDEAIGKPVLAVGPSAALAMGVNVNALGVDPDEGFVLTDKDTMGSTLPRSSWVLTGTGNSSRGCLYAVYHLLGAIGVDFVAYDETFYPSVPAVEWEEFRMEQPSMNYRFGNSWAGARHEDWARRQHYNQYTAVIGGISYASPPGFVHTSYRLLGSDNETGGGQHPPAALYAAHPEWFWPHDDPTAYGQLCWMADGLIDFVIERVKLALAASPNATIISVSQNDNQNYCKDTKDAAVIKEEGSPSAPLLRAVNAVARALRPQFPHVMVDTLAYQYTRPPPNITKPESNVIIRLCSIECNFAVPLTDPSNAAFQKDLEGWSTLSSPPPQLYIWDYITNFANYVMPFPNWYSLAPNIAYFLANGVKGLFEEGSYQSPGGDMDELRSYITARAMWDPTLRTERLINTFVDRYYGAGGPAVRTYLETMHTSVLSTGYYMHESFPWTAPFLTPNATLTSAAALQQGMRSTKLTEMQRERMERATLPLYYVILLRWSEMQTWADLHAVPWPVAESKTDAYQWFAEVYQQNNMTHLSESGHSLDWFHSQVFGA